jgi:putative oxidoreductase
MSIYEPSSSAWTSRMLSILRIISGLMFILAGTMKVFNYPPMPPDQPAIELMSQIGIGALMEVIGGALFTIGLFTRPVSFLLAGEMAVAYFQFHAPGGFLPNVNGGIPAVLYCFIFLYFMFAGAGVWSVDALLARRRS